LQSRARQLLRQRLQDHRGHRMTSRQDLRHQCVWLVT
jgi:hypothetical protein